MPKRPRLLLSVHNADRGGAELMALAQARDLSRSYDLVIAIPEGPLRGEFQRYGELTEGTASLPLWGASARRWLSRTARTVAGSVRILRVIRHADVDLVLTNSSVSLAPVIAARVARIPAIVHARDVPESRLAGLVFAVHGALADTIIVIAEELGRRFRHSVRARLVRIPDGIEIPEPAPNGRGRASGDPLRLCLVGGIDPRKGQDIAVEALARLQERGVRAELELIGREVDRSFAARIRERADRLRVADRLRIIGEVPDVGPALGRADVIIAPSRSEWTPLSLMEAMASAKPVVAASVGGIADVVVDGEGGLLIPPEDVDALTNALVELAADPARAREMGRSGRRHAAARFDISRTLDELGVELRRTMKGRVKVGAP